MASSLGDLEPFDVGQADVEQDEVGSEGSGGLETRQSVGGLADDLEAVRGEERARLDAEAGGVIDDEDGVHVPIVAGASDALLQGYPGQTERWRPCAPAVLRPDPEPESGSTLLLSRVPCVRVPP